MKKDKRYTRAELESVRRADLQSLFKVHGLKGANKSTNQLIDELLVFFASPSFISKNPSLSSQPPPATTTRVPIKTSASAKSRSVRPTGPERIDTTGTGSGQSRPGQPYERRLRTIEIQHGRLPVRGTKTKFRGDGEKELSEKGSKDVSETGDGAGEIISPVTPVESESIPVAEIALAPASSSTIAGPSKSKSPIPPQNTDFQSALTSLNDRLERLEVQNATLLTMLDDKEKAWEERLRQVEEDWRQKLRAAGEEWGRKLVAMEDTRRMTSGAGHRRNVSFASDVVGGEPSVADRGRQSLGVVGAGGPVSHGRPPASAMRKYSAEGGPGEGIVSQESGPASKKARRGSRSDTKQPSPPRTPSPGLTAPPKTPSPSHQGTIPDNSKTPIVNPEYFANAPSYSVEEGMPSGGSGSRPGHDRKSSSEMIETLPFPFFATTPKLSEPKSPTTDAPPSASRHKRTASYPKGNLTPLLTPSRVRRGSEVPTSRAVSDAHKELSTITESEEASAPASERKRRVASVDPSHLASGSGEGLLGPCLSTRGSSVPTSPPRLSASPSIGDRDGFSYTPFPPVPRSQTRPSQSAQGTLTAGSSRRQGVTFQGSVVGEITTPPPSTRSKAGLMMSSSPMQEYMDIASYGGAGFGGSPSTIQTPGHRTMLGTERYRDTRFGDVPVMSWGTPSVDLGGGTPRTSIGSIRRSGA